jgi:glycosyltransferase involved in cell wall biosynthesis
MLVILSPGFPENEQDNTCLPAFQQFAYELGKLRGQGSLCVISFQYPFAAKNYLWHGIQVYAIGGANKKGIIRILTWIKVIRRLIAIRKQRPVTGILSLWITECALIGELFSRRKNIPHYAWLIGQDAKKENRYAKLIHMPGNKIIAMSESLQSLYHKNHGEKPFMIADNGISPAAFPELNTGTRDIDILGVGSLIPLKNYDLFIELLVSIRKNFPSVKAVIAGEGPLEDHLKKRILENKLENNLTMAGKISHASVLDLMNRSKVFLHTSSYEGNSTVIHEALFSGSRVVTTISASAEMDRHCSVTKDPNVIISIVSEILTSPLPAKRVLVNSMENTAEKINRLFF